MATTRRSFLESTLAAAAGLAAPRSSGAQRSRPGGDAATPAAAPAPAPAPAPPTPAVADPRLEALQKLARERYGKFLAPEELAVLDDRIAALDRRSERLRATRLSNAEEPAFGFRAVRR